MTGIDAFDNAKAASPGFDLNRPMPSQERAKPENSLADDRSTLSDQRKDRGHAGTGNNE
jgi:hypothetical protein